MEHISVIIEGYLTVAIKNNKDALSRQTKTQIRLAIPEGNGELKKFEVLNGVIFVDVETQVAADAIVAKFNSISGVNASITDTFQAVYRKAKLRPVPAPTVSASTGTGSQSTTQTSRA